MGEDGATVAGAETPSSGVSSASGAGSGCAECHPAGAASDELTTSSVSTYKRTSLP